MCWLCYCDMHVVKPPVHDGDVGALRLLVTCMSACVSKCDVHKILPRRSANARLTKEYRESMVKLAKKAADDNKARVRRVRQKGIALVRDEKDSMSKDDTRRMEEMVGALSDKYSAEIDAMATAKAKELMG
eukprot:m.99002 g.99002  ORF g.99002 m.99002 type:complete len:131 (+) comp8708_c0_seq1:536-928(+)